MADKFSKGTGQPVPRADGMRKNHSTIKVPKQSTGEDQAQTKSKK